MATGSTISRADGSLSTAPTFAGTVNLVYTSASPISTGYEIPTSATVLANLTTNAGGVVQSALPATVSTLYSQGFNGAPTGWATETVTGTTGTISYVTTGTYPTCSPSEGTQMVKFNSYSASSGDQNRLKQISSISTTGKTNITVVFDWQTNTNYNYVTEGVTVQWSTNGTAWTSSTFYQAYESTSGWKTKSCVLPAGCENQANLYIAFLFTSAYGYNCYLDNLKVNGTTSLQPSTCTITGTLDLTNGSYSIGANTLALNGGVTATNSIIGGTTSNLTVGGSGANLSLPAITNGVNNFTLTRTNGATLNSSFPVTGTLNLTSGILTTGSNTVTSSGTIPANYSSSSYVDGKLARVITIGSTATTFPVGKGGNYRPVIFTYTAAPGSKTVTIEQFESDLLSYANTSKARFGLRYWNITQSATGITYTVGLNNGGQTGTGNVVILRREGTGTTSSNATSFSTPTYTNSTDFSTGNVSNDVQLGENSIPLTISSAAATNKVYDKNKTAAITGTLSGVVSPDVVTLNGTGTFASENVSDGINVTSTSTISGANASSYTLTQPTGLTANITARPLTITGAANTKTFDGNISSETKPTITTGTLQGSDVAAFIQEYNDATVGTPKVMTPSGTVSDDNSGHNYSYSFVTSNNGTITPATSAQWNGSASANWNTAGNWTPPVAPAAGISAVIVNAGTAPVISSTGNECSDLTITSGSLHIADGGALTVNGTLTNSVSGYIGLVVNSGGSLIQSSASVRATVERDINAWGDATHGWHFLSSPVTAQAVSSGFTTTTANEYDFYAWWEPTNKWVNYKYDGADLIHWSDANVLSNAAGQTSGGDYFIPGKGYLVEYKNAATKQFTGALNIANVDLAKLTISSLTNNSWHLLGNPFTSALQWGTTDWNLTYINEVAKVWKESTAEYIDVQNGGPHQNIPAMNGFMVQVMTGHALDNAITIPAAARLHDATTAWYKSTDIPYVLLEANDPAGQTAQESILRFDNKATAGFDAAYDSHFLEGYAPKFYSLAGEEHLSTNTLPEVGGTVQVPFAFIKNDGASFTIEAKKISNLYGPVILNDLKTSATQDLTANPVYSFTSESGDNPNRFLLTFSHVGIGNTQKINTFTVYTSDNRIFVLDNTGKSIGNVFVYNMVGQLIQQEKLTGGNLTNIGLDVATGYYLIKIVTNEQTYSTKIFISK